MKSQGPKFAFGALGKLASKFTNSRQSRQSNSGSGAALLGGALGQVKNIFGSQDPQAQGQQQAAVNQFSDPTQQFQNSYDPTQQAQTQSQEEVGCSKGMMMKNPLKSL